MFVFIVHLTAIMHAGSISLKEPGKVFHRDWTVQRSQEMCSTGTGGCKRAKKGVPQGLEGAKLSSALPGSGQVWCTWGKSRHDPLSS